MQPPELTAEERAIYEWQMWLPGFGEPAQRKLKGASVLVSRVGGLGGNVAYQLAAAGVGWLVLDLGAMEFRRLKLTRRADLGSGVRGEPVPATSSRRWLVANAGAAAGSRRHGPN